MTTATATTQFAAALEAAATSPVPDLLRELRTTGRARFEATGLPSRRQESWRFTRLKDLENVDFGPLSAQSDRIDISPWRREGCHTLVFVDGVYSPDISTLGKLPDGVVVSNLVLSSAVDSEVVANHLGRLPELTEHPFAALNTALLADGALIHLPENTVIEQPIQLIFVAGKAEQPGVRAPRVLIVADKGSRATVEELHVGEGGSSLSCPVTEIVLGEGAVLDHVVVQQEDWDTSHLATRDVVLAAASRYTSQTISLGGRLARNDIQVVLDGEGAEAILDGLYVSDGDQQADTHLTVRHRVPNCQSHQLYKGVLGGRSRAVFNGRIIVDQDAQQTNANQSNRNLLLSDDAVVNSNPQLEIFADDVRCTHGSTVGRLDEEAVFYLRSRGIDTDGARQLLTLAFAGEILDRLPSEDLRNRLQIEIEARLNAMAAAGVTE